MKILSFFYGIIVYVVFLGVFLYAIAFVGDFIVPKTINTGETAPFIEALIINLVLLSIFALQHSIMARPAFKKWWTNFVPRSIERSTYVLFSNAALILLFWQWRPMVDIVWEAENAVAVYLLWGLFALGWSIVFLSTFMINHFDLFGLKQVYENLKRIPTKPIQFKVNYFYGIIRHPLMLGFIIAFWFTPVMTIGHLVFALTSTLYILVVTKYLEEKDLLNEFGEEYAKYQREVPMIIPMGRRAK